LKAPVLSLVKGQRGVTGLETAIILIAFVVVASVFAFTVLSTGIFSAERGKETVFAGLEQARGSVELKGSVIANGVVDTTLSTADSAWTDIDGKATATRDATDKKQGTYSGDMAVAASQTGLLAYEAISPTLDLTNHDSIQMWVKSSVAVNTAGNVQLRISDSTTCGTSGNYEDINLPVLAANTWKHATVGISAGTTRSSVACVGIVASSAFSSAATINFDDILVRGQITSVVVTVANSVEGEPVDLTGPSDSDDDGTSDNTDTQQKVIISYSDADQLKNDLYWTKNFIGVNDADDLLEEGERVELTVQLKALDQATPLTRNKDFTIEVKPSSGSVLAIQRTSPAKIDTVMNLQ
jgi:flagellin-like protein